MDGDTLVKALADVRRRRIELEADHERITAELAKLRVAEASLAAVVEGGPLPEPGDFAAPPGASADGAGRAARTGRRGARGPRANSAKGRLRTLIEETGPQGLTQAEILRRLPDVAPATVGAYLSGMVSSGEILRHGDFFKAGAPQQAAAPDAEDEAAADEAAA